MAHVSLEEGWGDVTGDQKQELLETPEEQAREDVFLKGEFGTPDKPVIVPSYFKSRIVGCTGSPTEPHDILWHVVSEGKPLVCLECGQVFELRREEIPDYVDEDDLVAEEQH